jgi:cytochrome c556
MGGVSKRFPITACAVALLLLAGAMRTALSNDSVPADTRTSLGLTLAERADFLAQMRQMLASIEGIVTGVGTGDRALIAEAARLSGNRMARATPAAVRDSLPAEFKALGGPTHLLFEEIAVRAETDDVADLAELTGRTLQQCLACHTRFRVD